MVLYAIHIVRNLWNHADTTLPPLNKNSIIIEAYIDLIPTLSQVHIYLITARSLWWNQGWVWCYLVQFYACPICFTTTMTWSTEIRPNQRESLYRNLPVCNKGFCRPIHELKHSVRGWKCSLKIALIIVKWTNLNSVQQVENDDIELNSGFLDYKKKSSLSSPFFFRSNEKDRVW